MLAKLDRVFGLPYFLDSLDSCRRFDEVVKDRQISDLKVDIEETDEGYILTADVPGISKDELNLDIEGDNLVISYERKKEKKNLLRNELFYGRYERTFRLLGIDRDKCDATLKDGVLTVKLEKEEKKKNRKLVIN